ncbi:MAG: hypothetical protein OXF50_02445, partial [Caldilineaceae bacterium]|nr:hypothetical protein [Caldilineaceae bacterium]
MTASQDHDSRLVSALANAACLKYKPKAYLLYGIQDETHEVVGTSFDPYTEKGKGNQDLLPWITAGLGLVDISSEPDQCGSKMQESDETTCE